MILTVECGLRKIKIKGMKGRKNDLYSGFAEDDTENIWDGNNLKKTVQKVSGKSKIRAISFRVLFGGEYFRGPVLVDKEFFTQFKKVTEFAPFYISTVTKTLRHFRAVFKNIPVIVFFETSFFVDLPDEEKYYALPFEYHKNNKLRKWGSHGIFHQDNAAVCPYQSRTVSIVFDKQITVCAVKNMKPKVISLGYTPLEGIMSRRSCGDLDPGIPFYLMNVHKYSFYQIDQMLKQESGFLGLTGYDMPLEDMLKIRGKDKKVDLAFEICCGQILKYIGKGISVMGGLDNIVFGGGIVAECSPLIHEIMKKISFLGVNTGCLPWDMNKERVVLSSDESTIGVYANKNDVCAIMYERTKFLLKSKKNEK
jgi:acetate kinase